MENTFTNEIISFLYDENINELQKANFEVDMKNDFLLEEEYRLLKKTRNTIPKVSFKPSKITIQNILAHSRQTNPITNEQ